MVEPINIGFIGGGPRGHGLYSHLIFNEEMEDKVIPIACLDPKEQVRKDWEYKVDSIHLSLDSLLKDDVDAVIISSPPNTHADLAVKCLQAGLHVWSEVPMALSMEDIWKLIDAEKSNKSNTGTYSLGENYCYMLQPQFIAQQNRKNCFGEIYYAEGEYTHSVEHYMIEENYLTPKTQEFDPEITRKVTPTWRATFIPVMYGHALGPCLYFLNENMNGVIERPRTVSCMGNMKMQKRFGVDNFQIATVQTDQDTIIKYVLGFVLGHHGRIFYSAWGSGGIFNGASFQTKKHHYYEVPPDKRYYPARHEQIPLVLTDDDLITMDTPHGAGGHGGADQLMFQAWIDAILKKERPEINVFRAAEMTAPGILAVEAEKQKKIMEIPIFK